MTSNHTLVPTVHQGLFAWSCGMDVRLSNMFNKAPAGTFSTMSLPLLLRAASRTSVLTQYIIAYQHCFPCLCSVWDLEESLVYCMLLCVNMWSNSILLTHKKWRVHQALSSRPQAPQSHDTMTQIQLLVCPVLVVCLELPPSPTLTICCHVQA